MFSLSLAVVAATASAEMAEINVAQQYGVSFLPLMLMERDPLYLNVRRLPGFDPKPVTSAGRARKSADRDRNHHQPRRPRG